MDHRIFFDYDDETIIAMQRKPRFFYERIYYLGLYDNKIILLTDFGLREKRFASCED